MALVIDKADAHLGATVGGYSHISAQDLTPALLEHELSHTFGCGEAFLDSPSGPIAYGNLFCVMGAEGAKYSFDFAPLVLPAEPNAHALSGPGMTAPTLLANGWLDLLHNTTARNLADAVAPAGSRWSSRLSEALPAPWSMDCRGVLGSTSRADRGS